jgi:hypothetical protein
MSERVAHVLKLARPHAAPEFALTEPLQARAPADWYEPLRLSQGVTLIHEP